MTLGRPLRSSICPRLRPSAVIRLTDRFASPREAVIGWNPGTAGFEAAVAVFDRAPNAASGLGAGAGQHDGWILGSPTPSVAPTVVIVGREPSGDGASVPVGHGTVGPEVAAGPRTLCLTVDSLLDALRFEGFRFDVAATERMSKLADQAEHCNGPTVLRGRTWIAAGSPWIRLGFEHPFLPGSHTIFKRRSCGRLDLLGPARRIIELCWTQRWTPVERDLALTLALDVLADARGEFCFSATDVAHWCLSGRAIPDRVGASPRSRSSSESSQLRLALEPGRRPADRSE